MTQNLKKHGVTLWVEHQPSTGNALKHFLSWMRFKGPRTRFSHADISTTLHPELSLVENLLMAAEEDMLEASYQEKEAFLKQRLESEGLRTLASWFQDPRRIVKEMSEQEKFMATVCYALLRNAEETFVDFGRVSLEPLCLSHVQKVLQEKAQSRHITVKLADRSVWALVYDDEFVATPQGLERRAA